MPEGWRRSRAMGEQEFSLLHVIEPFVAAGTTLVRWTYYATVGSAQWLYSHISVLVITYPSGVVMAVFGAGIGFLAARKRQARHRRKSR